ncbi:DUF1475 family protein [Acanthopleuribacter pedis]|uniref:DUF1475 family protein n=1 Tax=Acanthopleuribacter pedis TaxID=442870 RepID=A0A8J7QCY0_9BACT|nr:DUF1475 family protein [Acanthopleuribacter pedis]
MIVMLRVVAPLLCVTMTALVIQTSLQSNLLEEWDSLAAIPWMRTTLVDFYYNILLLIFWAFYKEQSWASRVLWLVLFVCTGAIATALYVAVQAYRVPVDAPLAQLLLNPDDYRRFAPPA